MKDQGLATHAISQVLKFGSYGSTLLMLAGLLLAFVWPAQPAHYGMNELVHRFFRLDPVAVMQAGIALLLLTPVFRVIVAIFSFAGERDYRYTWISVGVLLIVLSSILFRLAH